MAKPADENDDPQVDSMVITCVRRGDMWIAQSSAPYRVGQAKTRTAALKYLLRALLRELEAEEGQIEDS